MNRPDRKLALSQAQGDLKQASDISDGNVPNTGVPNSLDLSLQ
jgi:hypothetical protein